MEPHEIKALRKKLGLTQAELYAAIGLKEVKADVAHVNVSRWERGLVKPSSAASTLLAQLARRTKR